jgi:hypothetical protein
MPNQWQALSAQEATMAQPRTLKRGQGHKPTMV